MGSRIIFTNLLILTIVTVCTSIQNHPHSIGVHNRERLLENPEFSNRGRQRHQRRQVQPPTDWESGLREAANQALLRERFNDPDLRERLTIAPLIGQQNKATPFGDIAVLARGQLYANANGFQFVQEHSECAECGDPCDRVECSLWLPRSNRRLLALWTVKRIRHKDHRGHRYELEYTISPISAAIREDFVTRNGGFDYSLPGHVFIVKPKEDFDELWQMDNTKTWPPNERKWPVGSTKLWHNEDMWAPNTENSGTWQGHSRPIYEGQRPVAEYGSPSADGWLVDEFPPNSILGYVDHFKVPVKETKVPLGPSYPIPELDPRRPTTFGERPSTVEEESKQSSWKGSTIQSTDSVGSKVKLSDERKSTDQNALQGDRKKMGSVAGGLTKEEIDLFKELLQTLALKTSSQSPDSKSSVKTESSTTIQTTAPPPKSTKFTVPVFTPPTIPSRVDTSTNAVTQVKSTSPHYVDIHSISPPIATRPSIKKTQQKVLSYSSEEEDEDISIFSEEITTITPKEDTPSEKPQDYPDSINAQLPAPVKGMDTTIPYIGSTTVLPVTTKTVEAAKSVTPPSKLLTRSPYVTSSSKYFSPFYATRNTYFESSPFITSSKPFTTSTPYFERTHVTSSAHIPTSASLLTYQAPSTTRLMADSQHSTTGRFHDYLTTQQLGRDTVDGDTFESATVGLLARSATRRPEHHGDRAKEPPLIRTTIFIPEDVTLRSTFSETPSTLSEISYTFKDNKIASSSGGDVHAGIAGNTEKIGISDSTEKMSSTTMDMVHSTERGSGVTYATDNTQTSQGSYGSTIIADAITESSIQFTPSSTPSIRPLTTPKKPQYKSSTKRRKQYSRKPFYSTTTKTTTTTVKTTTKPPKDDFLTDIDYVPKKQVLPSGGDFDIFGSQEKENQETSSKFYSNLQQTESIISSGSPESLEKPAPKIIYEDFFEASTPSPTTAQTTFPTTIYHTTFEYPTEVTELFVSNETTAAIEKINEAITSQSFSTSISFEVNKVNKNIKADEKFNHSGNAIEIESAVKAELTEIGNTSHFKIYMAEMPLDTEFTTEALKGIVVTTEGLGNHPGMTELIEKNHKTKYPVTSDGTKTTEIVTEVTKSYSENHQLESNSEDTKRYTQSLGTTRDSTDATGNLPLTTENPWTTRTLREEESEQGKFTTSPVNLHAVTTQVDTNKVFNDFALSLVNHARTIDLLGPKDTEHKYKRRAYKPRAKRLRKL